MANIPGVPAARGAVRKMIEELAYFRAERRGFVPGHELEDWLEAEREVLGGGPVKPAERGNKKGGGRPPFHSE